MITVTTNGGSFTLRPDLTIDQTNITTLPDVVTTVDVGDTLATALAVTLPSNSRVTIDPAIGDNAFGINDVDLFSITANAGDALSIDVTRIDASLVNSYVRLFDAIGNELAADVTSGPGSNPRISLFSVPATDTYYIGVSSWVNNAYDPNVAGSGFNGLYTGDYLLDVERLQPDVVTSGDLGGRTLRIFSTRNRTHSTRRWMCGVRELSTSSVPITFTEVPGITKWTGRILS